MSLGDRPNENLSGSDRDPIATPARRMRSRRRGGGELGAEGRIRGDGQKCKHS